MHADVHFVIIILVLKQGKMVMTESLYELVGLNSLETLCETTIPLQSELRCYSYDETTTSKLALGCCDSSLTIYCQEGKITQFTNTAFVSIKF